MSIIELGALGEFLGSIGVIATLVYLAIQIRQNTHSLDENRQLAIAESYQARTEMLHESWLRTADSDELAHIATKYMADGATALTPQEARRLRAQNQATLSRLDNVHFHHQLGYITDEFYESTFREVVRIVAPQWQDLGVRILRPSFREEVDRILAESEENEQ